MNSCWRPAAPASPSGARRRCGSPHIGWLGLLGLISGLACGQVFLHGFVLSVLPATFTRTAAALAIGFGAAASLLTALFYASVPTLRSPWPS